MSFSRIIRSKLLLEEVAVEEDRCLALSTLGCRLVVGRRRLLQRKSLVNFTLSSPRIEVDRKVEN
jgi:hypothetical protein